MNAVFSAHSPALFSSSCPIRFGRKADKEDGLLGVRGISQAVRDCGNCTPLNARKLQPPSNARARQTYGPESQGTRESRALSSTLNAFH
jgi:hypothetical protein